ncbi:FAD binding domain-containing protein [Lipomyces starkeyi]
MARTMNAMSGLSQELWPEALKHAVKLSNMLPTCTRNGESPVRKMEMCLHPNQQPPTYPSAVEWLQDVGSGHSQPRTYRGHDFKSPGMAITYALIEKLEDYSETIPNRVKIFKKSRVTKLIQDQCDELKVLGVEYENENGERKRLYGPVVLATGGYAADFSDSSLLKQYRPDVYGLATGVGQTMIMQVGGLCIDLDKVQVHPTGLVDPKEPDNKWKFLSAETLRGEGGLLLNAEGDRFCDELGHRDYVFSEIFKTKSPIRLVFNGKASSVLDFHTKHYYGRGLMRKMTGHELANDIGCGKDKLKKVLENYNDTAAGKRKDPYGKKYFHNLPLDINDNNFHVALVTQVLHFTVGGAEITDRAQVLHARSKEPFDGLYACGELAGGVHGANRLGGSSLLGSGDSASQCLFQNLLKHGVSTASKRLPIISFHIDPSSHGHFVVDTAEKKSSPTQFSVPTKEFTLDEVSQHNKNADCWVIVKNLVMDVTNFLNGHPGGVNAIFNAAGREATAEFEMLHENRVIPKNACE